VLDYAKKSVICSNVPAFLGYIGIWHEAKRKLRLFRVQNHNNKKLMQKPYIPQKPWNIGTNDYTIHILYYIIIIIINKNKDLQISKTRNFTCSKIF
jgi:hypothetical protein